MMTDADYMRLALRLARRGRGRTSPNPMVGAVVVQGGVILGRGWHHRAGEPQEVEVRSAENLDQTIASRSDADIGRFGCI